TGRTVIEVFCDHALHSALRETLETGADSHVELTLETRGLGHWTKRHCEVALLPLRADAGKPGALMLFRDTTKMREMENVRRDFVANVSHELRTPLSIINGYIETLLDDAQIDRATAETFLAIMQKHSQHMARLVEDLLTISRLESGAAELHFEPVSLRECI